MCTGVGAKWTPADLISTLDTLGLQAPCTDLLPLVLQLRAGCVPCDEFSRRELGEQSVFGHFVAGSLFILRFGRVWFEFL